MRPKPVRTIVQEIVALLDSLEPQERYKALTAARALLELDDVMAPASATEPRSRPPGKPRRQGPHPGFTDDEVRAFRQAHAGGTLNVRKLAEERGMSRPGVYSMLQGITYRHVK